jgi:hypothetical protein
MQLKAQVNLLIKQNYYESFLMEVQDKLPYSFHKNLLMLQIIDMELMCLFNHEV